MVAVTAKNPPIDNHPPQDPTQERIDNLPQEEQHPLSSLQLAIRTDNTPEAMDANDHINCATRKAEVSDGRFDRKMKKKIDQDD